MTPEGPSIRPTRASTAELLRLAWPLVLTNSAWTLQIVLDRVLLSRSSTEAVGAGMAAAAIFWSCLTLFQWTVNYATTFVAQYTGANQPHRIGPVIGQALWLAVLFGLGFALLAPFAAPIVSISGHPSDLQLLEAIYFRYLCLSALPTLVSAAVGSFFAGRGDSRTVLLLTAVGLVVNAGCAIVLIDGHLGFEPLGIAGASWATVAGTTTSALVGLVLLARPEHVRRYHTVVGWGLDRALLGRLVYYGLPQGIGTFCETAGFTGFLIFVGRLGKADLAATSIALTLNLLAFLPMMGIGQAVEILVGQRLGENQPRLAARSVWTGAVVAAAFTVLVAAVYVLVPGQLALPFRTQHDGAGWAAVEALIPPLLRFVALYCLFDSLNLVFAFALRGAGDTRFTMLVCVVCWPILVGPAWAAWTFGWGLFWAWGFASLYVWLLTAIYLARFLQGKWRSMRVIERSAALPDWEPQGGELVPNEAG